MELMNTAITNNHSRLGASKEIAQHITDALRNLAVDAVIFIDDKGQIFSEKNRFIQGESEPLVSFKRLGEDSFEVFPGIPPRNLTYVVGKNNHALTELKYDAFLSSGQVIYLSELKIKVPDRNNPPISPDPAQKTLLEFRPGELCSFGRRNIAGCVHSVSRVHLTVSWIDTNYGEYVLHVKLGMPTTKELSFRYQEGRNESPLNSPQELSSGAEINLGQLGIVKLPYSNTDVLHKVDEIYGEMKDLSMSGEQISELVDECASQYSQPNDSLLIDFNHRDSQCDFSKVALQFDRPNATFGGQPRDVLLANLLEKHITSGLDLIKQGRYQDSLEHFRDSRILETLGYSFEENNHFWLSRISTKEIRTHVRLVGSRSWFLRQEKKVYPSVGVLQDGLAPRNEKEKKLLDKWAKEISLIFAEEYTHALQDYLQRGVSRKAALITHPEDKSSFSHEADVALFFYEQGVSLSKFYLNSYRDERPPAIRIVKGFQTSEEQQNFSEMMKQVTVGKALVIGRDPKPTTADELVFALSKNEDSERSDRNKALSDLGNHAIRIERQSSGDLLISATTIGETSYCPYFIPDSAGFYHLLDKPTIVRPGTPFYIGRGFKFILE